MAEEVSESGGFRQFEHLDRRLVPALEDHHARASAVDAGTFSPRPGRRFKVIALTHCVPRLGLKQEMCLWTVGASSQKTVSRHPVFGKPYPGNGIPNRN